MGINLSKAESKDVVDRLRWAVCAVLLGILLAMGIRWLDEHLHGKIPVEESYAALFRQLKADEICATGDGGYFIHFDSDDVGEKWGGWWKLSGIEFHRNKVNATWYLGNIADGLYEKVWPNVHGMKCGVASSYEGK